MALDEKERVVIKAVLLTIGEERLRVQERINDLVKQAIKLRTVEVQLEETFDRLAGLLSNADRLENTLRELKQQTQGEQI